MSREASLACLVPVSWPVRKGTRVRLELLGLGHSIAANLVAAGSATRAGATTRKKLDFRTSYTLECYSHSRAVSHLQALARWVGSENGVPKWRHVAEAARGREQGTRE
jgi:hypothetical protein